MTAVYQMCSGGSFLNGCGWRCWLVLMCLLGLPTAAGAAGSYVLVFGMDDVIGSASYAGVALVILGVALVIAEAFVPSFGVIGFGGIVAFIVGAILLLNTDVLGFTLELPMVVSAAAIGVVCLMGLVAATLKSRKRQIVSGDAGLVGSSVIIAALQPDDPLGGWVQLQGERWQVLSQAPLNTGQRVRVVARRGVMLEVTPIAETPQRGD
jgi:membrane-bound serine protease (ClpP class)